MNKLTIDNKAANHILDLVPYFVIQYDRDGRITYINHKLAVDLHVTSSQVIGQLPNEVWPDKRFDKIQQAAAQAVSSEEQVTIEMSRIDGAGNPAHSEIHIVPEKDTKGNVVGTVAFGIDVTTHKEYANSLLAQAQLEELVSLQSHALDIIGEAVYLIDRESKVHYVNNAACKMLGYTKDELMALKVADFDAEFDLERYIKHWSHLQISKTETLETQHKTKNGVYIPVEIYANAIEFEGEWFNFALVHDISERKRVEAQILHQASYDMLTGLPNRRLLVDRLEEEMSQADRSKGSVSLLFVDLDRFKEINDTLGHSHGDLLLKEAAQRIQQCVRKGDMLARMGGDEFVIVMSGIMDMTAHLGHVAQSVIQTMASPFTVNDQTSYVSASIGIANYPADVDNLEALVSAADQAMYVAKEKGRNCYSFFTSAMQLEVQERLSLANELRQAIERKQLEVYLQPIIDVSSGQVVKAEALLRWLHPQYGMVPPNKFIPIAEEMGMIQEIGDWVFYQATDAVSRWLGFCQGGHECCQVTVNMSARQFISNDVGIAWVNHLKTIDIPAELIVIEITESLLLGDELDIMEKLHRFRKAGIKVALDDFGTGYSAMSYLKKFNIDYLKIDQSFVSDLETDANDRAIAEAIVVMAHKLGLKTIAEGVETDQQKAILTEVGCDYLQGYLYAKPMPVEDFLAYVQS